MLVLEEVHPDDAERPESRAQEYRLPPEPPEVVRVKVAVVTPSASIEAEDGLIEAVSAELTVTVARIRSDSTTVGVCYSHGD